MKQDREQGNLKKRGAARDKAREMYRVFRDARRELGPDASLRELAFFITGRGVLTRFGRRWSAQTISDVIHIDQVQAESCAKTMEVIRTNLPFPDIISEWQRVTDHEIKEAREIGETIRMLLR